MLLVALRNNWPIFLKPNELISFIYNFYYKAGKAIMGSS